MSLVNLAEQKKLPLFQYMDQETLDWIIKNKPKFEVRIPKNKKTFFKNKLDLIENFSVPKKWFFNFKLYDTIHGARHMLRCVVYSLSLAEQFKLSESKTKNLLIAAAIHDISRYNDKEDNEHGESAAKWFGKNYDTIIKYFNISTDKINKTLIQQSIALHEVPYTNFNEKQEVSYEKCKSIIDMLKTSDALDRYRLPKLKWWINQQFLRINPPVWLKIFAYGLVVESERFYLRGKSNKESVLLGLEEVIK